MFNAATIQHFPASALGSLRPPACLPDSHIEIMEGETVVNGVALSQNVIEELRKLGIALSWYNAGELQDAINATHYDSQLVTDHKGVHFRDKLHHSEEEKEADDQHWYSFSRMRIRHRKRKSQDRHNEEACPRSAQNNHNGIYCGF